MPTVKLKEIIRNSAIAAALKKRKTIPFDAVLERFKKETDTGVALGIIGRQNDLRELRIISGYTQRMEWSCSAVLTARREQRAACTSSPP